MNYVLSRITLFGPGSGPSDTVFRFVVYTALTGLAILFVMALGQGSFDAVVRFLFIGLLAAIAAFCVGVLLGLIFGVPETTGRVSIEPADAAAGNGATRETSDWYSDNSALERVSIWLTGAIIGLSLVNFNNWVERFESTAELITSEMVVAAPIEDTTTSTGQATSATENQPGANGARADPEPQRHKALGGLIMAAYALLGFFAGYLWTRRYLPSVLADARRAQRRRIREDSVEAGELAKRAAELGNQQKKTSGSDAREEAEKEAEKMRTSDRQLAIVSSQIEMSQQSFEILSPGSVPDDPWKNVFGGSASVNGVTLSANVYPKKGDDELFSIEVKLAITETLRPGSSPAGSLARVYLHPTFPNSIREYTMAPGRDLLSIPLIAYGAFTVGVQRLDNGDLLELDLATLPDAPAKFRMT
ncbi:MAG: hypothetical protein ACTS1Z_14545 [Parasphingopyxis sp.]|uniref:hypothetical protein n=1 Tax=Parasphingopyxis sp. TaxID=1920299 RepID=UPI003FA11105